MAFTSTVPVGKAGGEVRDIYQSNQATGLRPSRRGAASRAPSRRRWMPGATSSSAWPPPVHQLEDSLPEVRAGAQLQLVGPRHALEQPGPLAGDVWEHAHLKLVDQVQAHERPEHRDATP